MVTAAGIGLSSCENKSGSTDSNASFVSEVASDNQTAATDSVAKQETKTADVAKEEPKLSFATSQQALDYMNESPNAAKYAEGILPSMADANLTYTTNLLNNKFDKFLIIDKEKMRVGLFDKFGREILSYGIACSKNYGTKHKKADNRTPEGFFSVEGIYNSTDWLFTNDNGYTSPAKGQFGPRFIRIKNPVSTQIGLHGTASPGSIGRRCSHGCIRVTNDNILELVKYVTPGMPVIITPSERDQQVNNAEGYHIAKVSMDPYGKYPDAANGMIVGNTKSGTSHKAQSAANPAHTSSAEPVETQPAESHSTSESEPTTSPETSPAE